jgi:hypothetical protein
VYTHGCPEKPQQARTHPPICLLHDFQERRNFCEFPVRFISILYNHSQALQYRVPNVLGKRWACLAAGFWTFQNYVDQWITDQHVIDNLNAAIKTIINADFVLFRNKHDEVYWNSGEIIQQVGVLMDILRANECEEPKLEFGGYEQIIGIMYI